MGAEFGELMHSQVRSSRYSMRKTILTQGFIANGRR